VALGVVTALAVTLLILFPGRRFGMAFTLATGVGRQSMQERIDAIEERAIAKVALDDADRAFLSDFYRTLATGGKVTLVLGQTGRLMEHYLDGSGEDFRLDPVIFTENATVQAAMRRLRVRATSPEGAAGARLTSPAFHMADAENADSVYGLYWGTLHVTRTAASDGAIVLKWRAEVPWTWPSYASLEERHGSPHAECFPIPSLRSLVLGERWALRVDNGLGEHLAQEGLARPFLAYGEWDEEVPGRR
jgi:hypothetical protein